MNVPVKNLHISWIYYLLTGLVLVEILAQTYGFLWGHPAVSSILYFCAGAGVALLPMWKNKIRVVSKSKWPFRMALGLPALLIIWCIWRTPPLLSAAPLDYRQADMLPVIRIMGERWWAGEAVYEPIKAIWGGMQPIYLPAMWLPFSVGGILRVDLRWVSVSLLLVSLLLIFFGPVKKEHHYTGYLFLLGMLPTVLLLVYIFGYYSTLITLSEEPVVVFYYILLAWGLFRRQPVLTGIAIALCLLSRYALVFWVPMYLLYQFFYQSRKDAYLTGGTLAVSLILLLTIGQAWDQLPFFLHLQDNYLQELLKEESRWGFTAQIQQNPGLVKFLPYEGMATWHRLLIYGSLLLPALSLLTYRRYRRFLDHRFFGLCSLKLTMVFFYNMLTIPYSYLFYPSGFLSLFILFSAISTKKDH